MRRAFGLFGVCVLSVILIAGAHLENEETRVRRMFDSSCVVVLQTETQRGHGSGVVIAKNRVLTCAHGLDAFEGAKVTVGFARDGKDMEWAKAEVIKVDNGRDLALLKCDTGKRPPALRAELDGIRKGQRLVSFGCPEIGPPTTTEGLLGYLGNRLRHVGPSCVHTWQLGAFVEKGFSGGPAYRLADGRLVGIVVVQQNASTAFIVSPVAIEKFLE